jgi:ketosteroid isomerase-like protein
MTRSALISTLAGALLALAGCGGGSSPKSDEAQVKDLVATFTAAYRAEDAAGIAALCAFPFSLDGALLGTPEELTGALQAGFAAAGDVTLAEVVDPVVTVDGDAVVVTGAFHQVSTLGGESTRTVTITGVRLDGRWKATGFTQGD